MMSSTEDSRPFVQLKEDASEFSLKFDEDIKKCTTFLDEQITSLICDPESVSNSFGRVSLNAQMEFSKAKYDVFVKVRSLFNDLEFEWLKSISLMKKTFLENVEIFLAGTKLEVKLPTEETQARGGGKRAGRNKPPKEEDQSSSLSSSIYPIINSFTKKLSAIPSPLLRKSSHDDNFEESSEEAKDMNASFSRINRRLAKSNTSPKKTEVSSPFKSIYANPDNLPLRNRRSGLSNVVSSSRASLPSSHGVLSRSTEWLDLPQETNVSHDNQKISEESESSNSSTGEPILNSGSQKRNITHTSMKISDEISDDDSEEQVVEVSPKKTLRGRGRRTPAKGNLNTSEIKITAASNSRVSRSRTIAKVGTNKPEVATSTITSRGKGRRKTMGRAQNMPPAEINESDITEENEEKVMLKTPKKVAFTIENDGAKDLGLFPSDEFITKSAPRRRTMFKLQNEFTDLNVAPEKSTKVISKRKTIIGSLNLPDVSPPKRLKNSRKTMSSFAEEKEDTKDNILESDDTSGADGYTTWMSLKTIDKIPQLPGVYELKVWRAKKTAFIGSCENLRQKLTLHKLGQNSGHKHLDKFIERNLGDIQIRYEISSSISDAKQIVKDRVNEFVSQYKTTPAYN